MVARNLPRHPNIEGVNEQLVQLIGSARDILATGHAVCSRTPASAFTGEHGRPRYIILREQLEFYVDRCFSVVNMASLVRVSVRTVERHLQENGLSIRSTFSSIADVDLDTILRGILTEFPGTTLGMGE